REQEPLRGGPLEGERGARGEPHRGLQEHVVHAAPRVRGDDVREAVPVQVPDCDRARARGREAAVVPGAGREARDGRRDRRDEEGDDREEEDEGREEAGSPVHGKPSAAPAGGAGSHGVGADIRKAVRFSNPVHAATPPGPPSRTTSSAHRAAASKSPSFARTYPLFTHATSFLGLMRSAVSMHARASSYRPRTTRAAPLLYHGASDPASPVMRIARSSSSIAPL